MPPRRGIAERGSGSRPVLRVLLGVAVGLAAAAVSVAARPPAEPGAWTAPLPIPLGLTGTPGEYRTGHLHGGVDLSTGGKTGLPVRAVRPGTVVRVRASGSGYGRALHLRSDDGIEVIYGHLLRFAPALEAYTRDAQRGAGEYEVDLTPEPGRFVFAAGDTIAWSGESGAGPPHLHVEVRSDDLVRNALALGLQVPDFRPPELGPVGLRALGPDAFVAESTLAIVGAPPARVWGRVGIECRVVDASGTTSGRLAPLRIEATLDGASIFVRRFDRLEIGAGPEVQRVYGTLFDADGPWSYRLYRWPLGAEPDPTEDADESGIIDFASVPPGRHRLCIEACDASGGCSDIRREVEVRPPLIVDRWMPGAAADRSGGWVIGLHLQEPIDSTRLPLRLQSSAPAAKPGSHPIGRARAWSDAGEWLSLGQGWLCAYSAGGGPVRVVDRAGRLVLAPIQPGIEKPGSDAWSTSRLLTRVEEGMVLIEVFPPVPFPSLPRGKLVFGSGESMPLCLRGPSDEEGWLFACEPTAPTGEPKRLELDFGGKSEPIGISINSLMGFDSGDAAEPIRCLGGRLTVVPAAGSFYGGALLQVGIGSSEDSLPATRAGGAGRPAGRVTPLSPVVTLAPGWWPLGAPIRLRISRAAVSGGFDEATQSWGLYRRGRRGGWQWVGREADADGLGATTSELGAFALLDDRAAPAVGAAEPEDGARLGTPPAALRVRVSDAGSGFDPRAADIDLDGTPLLAVWDIDEGTLTAQPESVARGEHAWEVRVTDRAGNRTVARHRFVVTGP